MSSSEYFWDLTLTWLSPKLNLATWPLSLTFPWTICNPYLTWHSSDIHLMFTWHSPHSPDIHLIHLTFTWHSPDHLTIIWPSPDPDLNLNVRLGQIVLHLTFTWSHLTFTRSSPDLHLTTWISFDPFLATLFTISFWIRMQKTLLSKLMWSIFSFSYWSIYNC